MGSVQPGFCPHLQFDVGEIEMDNVNLDTVSLTLLSYFWIYLQENYRWASILDVILPPPLLILYCSVRYRTVLWCRISDWLIWCKLNPYRINPKSDIQNNRQVPYLIRTIQTLATNISTYTVCVGICRCLQNTETFQISDIARNVSPILNIARLVCPISDCYPLVQYRNGPILGSVRIAE